MKLENLTNRTNRILPIWARGASLQRCVLLVSLIFTLNLSQAQETIPVNLDLSQPGVQTNNVFKRSLFFADTNNPVSLGPIGIGPLSKPGSVILPFTATKAGSYKLVLSYGLIKQMRPISVKIDGAVPDASWQNQTLWASTPDYPWTSQSLYADYQINDCRSRHIICWTLSNTSVQLTAGSHTMELSFPAGEIVITQLELTTGQTPANSSTPWTFDSYVPFPALDFTDRVDERAGDRLRITFRGWWQNLAPHPVSFLVDASVMPRKGKTEPLYRITTIQPSQKLALNVGERTPFELAVESAGPIPEKYSEMILLNLRSLDVTNLLKPYLMCAANGYLDVDPNSTIRHQDTSNFAIEDDTNPERVIPTRSSLDFTTGYAKRTLHEAFVFALTNAPKAVRSLTQNTFRVNYTAWAQAGAPPTWNYEGKSDVAFYWTERLDAQRHPLARILDGQGQSLSSTRQLKAMMILLSQEMPYYSIEGRWDSFQPIILPVWQYERTGAGALASYVRLAQENAMSDTEHFRFLHNVVLPLYLAYRDDFRIRGTLARPVSAQAAQTKPIIKLSRTAPPKVFPQDMVGQWIRIGTGLTTEYVLVGQNLDDGEVLLLRYLPKYDHNEGEPWASFHMREWTELEGLDIWSYLTAAVTSRDSAVVEQVGEILEVLYSTQNVFREDGSFANEPGSYGWGAYDYMSLFQQITAFLSNSVNFSETLKRQMLGSLVMWNDFPFSDGIHPMLNGGGANNQLGRLKADVDPLNPTPLRLLREIFPAETKLINRYERIISQEANRTPGSFVDNRSFKVDGWGYAMLRGPGAWDRRMETLLSSKKLNHNPGDHVSVDTLGICLFAHGALMTPRYGYHWLGYPALLLNRVGIDRKEPLGREPRVWGDFLHFDDNRELPSAIAYTDMAEPFKTDSGVAQQERWNIQLPEYLFDAYFVNARDNQPHIIEWGFRNLGEVGIVSPQVSLAPAKNDDGTPWDPFGYYREESKHEGQGFQTDQMWQADWTMNEGNITFDAQYPNPPKGSKLRLTMAAEPGTKVVTAWVTGPGRNQRVELRQDLAVVRRDAAAATFIDTLEPISSEPLVQRVEIADKAADGALAVKVTTRDGTDWFLVGSRDFKVPLGVRRVGPFNTDAKLALVRVKKGETTRVMFSGGTSLDFVNGGVVSHYAGNGSNTFHYVAVSEVNTAPTLAAIADKTIDEAQTLTLSATATDNDTPVQSLTLSLGAGAPASASISAAGVFSWTPTESHGPWTYPITVIVTDNGTPPQSASRTFRVTVRDTKSSAKSYADLVKGDGPVGYWRLGELSGRTAKDELGRNNGTYVNAVTLGVLGVISSDSNTAARFSSARSQNMEVPWVRVLNSPAFTAEVWARLTGGVGSNPSPIYARVDGAGADRRGYNFYGWPGETWEFWTFYNGGWDIMRGPRVELNKWTHLVGTYDGTTKRFFVNGVEQGSSTVSFVVNDRNPIRVGASFEGDIDEPAIYDKALTAEQILLHYLAGIAPGTAPLIAPITDKTADAGALFDFTALATDADLPPQKLTFSLGPGAPFGASIDSLTGRLTWTPDLSQGGKTHLIAVRVTDDGNPPLSAETAFRVTVVIKPNTPPALSALSDVTVNEGSTVSLTASATDADLPVQNLTFSLAPEAPPGAAINSTNGVFTWTPIEAQGPSINLITVLVTDSGTPPLSATNRFTVTVNEVNSSPIPPAITDQSATESAPFTLNITATDTDLPTNALTYALTSAPADMRIDSATGLISWTPGEDAGGNNVTVTVQVTDNGTPPLSASRSFTVNVTEVNSPPALVFIPDASIDELRELTFAATATDSDRPANALTFSLDPGAPSGASISSVGAFNWTPTEAHGPGTYPVTVRVTDDGTPPLGDTKTFTVTVNEVNEAAFLATIPDKNANAASLLSFAVTATDADLPANGLTYTLEPGAPEGATIDPATGVLNWTPTAAQAGTTNRISIRITDNGVPPLSDAKAFTVVVAALASVPVHLSVSLLANGEVRLVWTTTPGRTYTLQRSADLAEWQDLTTIAATAASLEYVDAGRPDAQARFYRVVQR